MNEPRKFIQTIETNLYVNDVFNLLFSLAVFFLKHVCLKDETEQKHVMYKHYKVPISGYLYFNERLSQKQDNFVTQVAFPT